MSEKGGMSGLAACVGAVVGAGFVSGREVIAFFTRYGAHAPWLIALSSAAMALLCGLCMRRARRVGTENWWDLYGGMPAWVRVGARLCAAMMLSVAGGAMVSASGWLTALLWANEWAYPLGAVGTLLSAWLVGRRSLGALGRVSGLLTAVLIGALIAARMGESDFPGAVLAPPAGSLAWAAVRAVAYAAMNLTLAIGVVCRMAGGPGERTPWLCGGLGAVLAALLMLGSGLYARHPELASADFPIVRLLARYGRAGFVTSAALLYLAVFTSLAAVTCALDSAVAGRGPYLRAALAMGLPLAVSLVGFEGIVDGLYAPAGLACLMLVLAPLALRRQTAP